MEKVITGNTFAKTDNTFSDTGYTGSYQLIPVTTGYYQFKPVTTSSNHLQPVKSS